MGRSETKEKRAEDIRKVKGNDAGLKEVGSLRRVVTSADMKAKDVDKATPRTLTPEQRVATWS